MLNAWVYGKVDPKYWTARIEIIYNDGRRSRKGKSMAKLKKKIHEVGFKAKVALAAL